MSYGLVEQYRLSQRAQGHISQGYKDKIKKKTTKNESKKISEMK